MTQAGRTIHVVHDLDGNRLAEYEIDHLTGAQTLLQEYIWFDGVPVAVVDGQTDEVFFVRTDHIGRPVFATDSNGMKVWEASYLPFGGVHVSTGDTINLRFPGQWFHASSGLHQNWMRDYDPTTGRYVQADPLGLVDGASVYGYALQNPGRYVDPKGEQVNIMCRPLAGAAFATGAKHCAIFVVSANCECQSTSTHQFSMGAGDRRFNLSPTVSSLDLKFWNGKSSVLGRINGMDIYAVPVPPHLTECEFDYRVIRAGMNYSANSYSNPFGPNSNTAVVRTIENAGGEPPRLHFAPGQGFR